MVGKVVKSKIGELEEEVRVGYSIRMSKELSSVVQGLLRKKRFLERFQEGCKKNLSYNQPTVVIVENIPEEREHEVFTIPDIPEEKAELDKGYYCYFYAMLRFKNVGSVDINEEQVDVEDDPDEEDMGDVNLDNER